MRVILQDRIHDLWRKYMSKICEKCGNVIPDGADVCPNCGREDYNDEVLKDVLSELKLSLGDDLTEILETPVDQEDVPDLDDVIAEVNSEAASKPKSEESDVTMVFDAAKVREAAKEQKPAGAAKAPKDPTPKERVTRVPQKPRRQESEEPRTRNKKSMKKSSAAVVGVLIGLVVSLLLIAGGIGIMLFRMGFFNTMSDEELLGTAKPTAAVETAQVTPTEAPALETEAPSPEATVAEGSVLEETPAPSKEPIELDQFTVTGASTIYMYSRGETAKVSYVISPASAESEIEWSSDDETVATVDSSGTIRARRGGICTVKGECGDTYIAVTVVCSFEVPDTVLDMNMEDITMNYEGQTAQLSIDYDLTPAQVKATVWESSDPSVATVDDKGLVTAVADGTAVISASISDYTASCIVRCVDVTGSKGYNSDDSEYVINYTDVTLSRKGEYFQLTLTSVLGKDVPSFTWKSDDTDVATVDSKGVVTAVSNGTAYITTNIGKDQFRCIVRVNIS